MRDRRRACVMDNAITTSVHRYIVCSRVCVDVDAQGTLKRDVADTSKKTKGDEVGWLCGDIRVLRAVVVVVVVMFVLFTLTVRAWRSCVLLMSCACDVSPTGQGGEQERRHVEAVEQIGQSECDGVS
jgi:hypothetical protein